MYLSYTGLFVYPVYSGHMARKSDEQKKKERDERNKKLLDYATALGKGKQQLNLDARTEDLEQAKSAYNTYMLTNSSSALNEYNKFFRGMHAWFVQNASKRDQTDKNRLVAIPAQLYEQFNTYKNTHPLWREPAADSMWKVSRIINLYVRINKNWAKILTKSTVPGLTEFKSIFKKLQIARFAYWCERSITEMKKPKPTPMKVPPSSQTVKPQVKPVIPSSAPAAGRGRRRTGKPNPNPPRRE